MNVDNDIINLVADNTTLNNLETAFPTGCYCCEIDQKQETLFELEVDESLSASTYINICQTCKDRLIDIFYEQKMEDALEKEIYKEIWDSIKPTSEYMDKI